jgi:hypothetical protein
LALKAALGSEIRQFALMALEAHERFASSLDGRSGASMHDLEDACRFPAPIIYESNAASVGKFGNCVHDLVLFFASILILKQAIERMKSIHGHGFIGVENTKHVAAELLKICEIGEFLLPRIDNPSYFENADRRYCELLSKARAAWKAKYPPARSDVHS